MVAVYYEGPDHRNPLSPPSRYSVKDPICRDSKGRPLHSFQRLLVTGGIVSRPSCI